MRGGLSALLKIRKKKGGTSFCLSWVRRLGPVRAKIKNGGERYAPAREIQSRGAHQEGRGRLQFGGHGDRPGEERERRRREQKLTDVRRTRENNRSEVGLQSKQRGREGGRRKVLTNERLNVVGGRKGLRVLFRGLSAGIGTGSGEKAK